MFLEAPLTFDAMIEALRRIEEDINHG